MRTITALLSLAFAAAVIFAGCDSDSRVAKVSPQTGLDTNKDVGYNENYYDDQYAEDYQQYEESGNPEVFKLVTIHFPYDRFELTSEALDIMSSNADQLLHNPSRIILIEGHCDERGTEEYNLALGEKRALEARKYLVQYGVDPKRLSIVSYGESMPVALGQNELSWAKNRRADFVVLSQ